MLSNFNIGDKLSITQIKEKLIYIYSSINYTSVPKATDLEDYFTVKEAKINEILSDGSKKRVRGMELVDINLEYRTVYELLKRKGV